MIQLISTHSSNSSGDGQNSINKRHRKDKHQLNPVSAMEEDIG